MVALTAPGIASAQEPSEVRAEALFQRGLEDMLAGRYESGCPSIAESQRLDPRPGTMFTLAECEAKAGLVASALAHYEEFLESVERMPAERRARQRQRVQRAEAARRDISPHVPTLTLRWPVGAKVSLDGRALAQAELGVAMPVDPGNHVITTQAPGTATVTRRIAVAAGEHREELLGLQAATTAAVEVPLPSAPAPQGAVLPSVAWATPARAHPTNAVRGGSRWPAVLAVGGTVLAVAGGAALWVAHEKAQNIESATDRPFNDSDLSYPTWNTAGVTMASAGGLSLVAAGILWLGQDRQLAPDTHGRAPSSTAGSGPRRFSMALRF